MGRARHRLRLHSRYGGNGNGHGPDAALLAAVLAPPLSPSPAPVVKERPAPLAPVLELEGLDPWADIRGPALAIEECGDESPGLSCDDPTQLDLAPEAALDGPADGPGVTFADAAVVLIEPIPDAPAADPLPAAEIAPPPPPEPDPIELLYAEARQAADAGRCGEAEALYRRLLVQRSSHVRARYDLALLLDAAGNHHGALAELDRALGLEPENGALLVSRGALLGAMGRFAAAEQDLKKVLRVEPAHAEALFNLGVVMTKKGLWGEAVPHLQRAVELEPGRGSAHYYLGEALNHVDNLAGALSSYQRAAELQPDNPRALYGLGIIYDRLARPDDAAHMYRRSREVGRR
jgi:Flp pilus assembly protein TadD